MYYGEIERSSLSLALYIDLHPSAIASFTPISRSLPKLTGIELLYGLGDTF
jgi:hypothetical protein